MSAGGYLGRPKISSQDYGLPMACPKDECGYRWLKLPGIRMRRCPNCGLSLVSMRPRKKKRRG